MSNPSPKETSSPVPEAEEQMPADEALGANGAEKAADDEDNVTGDNVTGDNVTGDNVTGDDAAENRTAGDETIDNDSAADEDEQFEIATVDDAPTKLSTADGIEGQKKESNTGFILLATTSLLLSALFIFISCRPLPTTQPNGDDAQNAASVGVAISQPSTADAAPTASTPATPVAQTAVDDDIKVINLVFSEQDDTMLEAIAAVLGEKGEPERHQYVEFKPGQLAMWQGERLFYADSVVMIAQQIQAGGGTATRLDFPLNEARTANDVPFVPPISTTPPLFAMQETTTDAVDAVATFVSARMESEEEDGSSVWRFDVSIDHPDTGWEDYADGWHIETPTRRILGTRILLHPHVGERPFTRSLGGVVVPADVETVHVRTHDLISGYSGETVEIPLGAAASTDQYEVTR